MGMKLTNSEKNVFKFFDDLQIKIYRIPACPTHKSPDFLIKHNMQAIFIEVKEIEENLNETSIRKTFFGDPISFQSSDVVKRMRDDIEKATSKFGDMCKTGFPGILIIQDLRPFLTQNYWGLDEEIKQAMFGDREVWRNVRTNEITADIFARNKEMRSDKNTVISAVAYLIENEQNKSIFMNLFHNPFADNKLNICLINDERFNEYRISFTSLNCSSLTDYGNWEKV